jgi:hypothetical protein
MTPVPLLMWAFPSHIISDMGQPRLNIQNSFHDYVADTFHIVSSSKGLVILMVE